MKNRLLIDGVIILAITGGILLVAELGVRFAMRDSMEEPLYRFDQTFLYKLKPNLKIHGTRDYDNVLFETNADSFRGQPLNPHPLARAIVYGDSNVMSRWLNAEETFPYFLENNFKNNPIFAAFLHFLNDVRMRKWILKN